MKKNVFITSKNSRKFNFINLGVFCLFVGLSIGFSQTPNKKEKLKNNLSNDEINFSEIKIDTTGIELDSLLGEFSDKPLDFDLGKKGSAHTFWKTNVLDPMQIGVKYEMTYKFTKPDKIRRNRVSLRLKYSKLLFNSFVLQFDTKLYGFMKNDHRVRDLSYWVNDKLKKAEMSFGERTREVYLQTSFNKTSIKIGIQTLVWGESDFAAVTDELSPLDNREPLNLNIDELKLGQAMITIDQYSDIGNWSGFFIPYARLSENPKEGTGYYFDPFNGNFEFQKENQNKNFFEYGIRWKKSFKKSDVSIMAASLINNNYAIKKVSSNILSQSKYRYQMAGITSNYALNNFLFKGEAAFKSPKKYNDADLQIVEKNNFDALLGVEYSLNSTTSMSMEAINYHIIDWTDNIAGVPKDSYTLLFTLGKQLLNNDLSVNLATVYNGPNSSFFNLLSNFYYLNDHITLYLDVILPYTKNEKSSLWIYRNEKLLSFKFQYQF